MFCDVDWFWIQTLKCVLLCFEALTGLKVKLENSEMVVVVVVEDIDLLADILGCRVGSLPTICLGMPLATPFKASGVWNVVLEEKERRLASWERLYLGRGRRLLLYESTLPGFPTYSLSLFPIPCWVANHIEKLQWDCLWGEKKEEGEGGRR